MFLFLGMGAAVGFISGMFGVGGGFLLTPLLIFTGVSPAVAVATVTPQIVASSTSAALSYWRRHLIDEKMTLLLSARRRSRFRGSAFSVFARSDRSANSTSSSRSPTSPSSASSARSCCASRRAPCGGRASDVAAHPPSSGQHNWIHGLPLKTRFRRSKLYVSVIPDRGARNRHRIPRHYPGPRRRLHHGAGADLSAARADERRDRHLARLHADDHGGRDGAARHRQQVRRHAARAAC